MENEERLTQLEAEVEVLRAYVQALLALVPRNQQVSGHLIGVQQRLNGGLQARTPETSTALSAALQRLDPGRHAMSWRGSRAHE